MMRVVTIAKTSPIGEQIILDTQINIADDRIVHSNSQSLEEWQGFSDAQAQILFDALRSSLPGATFDRLMAKMMAHRVSSFKVLL